VGAASTSRSRVQRSGVMQRPAAALASPAGASVVHQDPAHHLGRHGEEVDAIGPAWLLAEEAKAGLLDHVARVQGRNAAAPETGAGNPAQVRIDEIRQAITSGGVAA